MATIDDLLTIVIPVKNEGKNLTECLDSVKDFAHVVIVDSGSTDTTDAIAARYGREVVQFKWDGHFPKKRNWILRNYQFKTPWVLFLDADERITPLFCEELAKVLPKTSCNAFICFYDNWFMGRMLKHGDAMRKTAILRVGSGEYEKIDEHGWTNLDMEIHEHLQVNGAVGVIKERLEHHDKRSVENYYRKHEEYAKWEANRYRALRGDFGKLTKRQRLKYSLIKWCGFGFAYFCASFFFKGGFLDGRPGYVFARGKWRYFANIRRKILESETMEMAT